MTDIDHAVSLTYTNWRGETSVRTIIPKAIFWGSTEWHPEPQWLLTAFDVEKEADRDFALKDFGQPSLSPSEQSGKEAEDFDIGTCPPDLASTLAVEIMGLKWTHGGSEDEHCYRYGELQEVIAAKLAEVPPVSPPPLLDAEREARLLGYFTGSVDHYKAAEWFDRLARATRDHDAARVAGDHDAADMYLSIMNSSSFRLVREFEPQVRAALSRSTTKTESGDVE